jgi:hypothetical protein
LRITELLPNPAEPGVDTEHEWVEITNVGAEPASTEGMQLGDNRGSVALDPFVLLPGESVVLAAPLADVGAAARVQRVQAIGNGLSNDGDRLILVAADGAVVDQLAYGTDRGVPGIEPVSTPGEGQSMERRFDPDGGLVDVVFLDVPTPGLATPMVSSESDFTPTSEANATTSAEGGAPDDTGNVLAVAATPAETSVWMVLMILAGGALGGAVLYRVSVIMRNRA